MYKEDGKCTDNIYENIDATKGKIGQETTDSSATRIQSSELTGSDLVKIRNYRAAVVCLVLLCVLLLAAVIVLCVTLTQEKQQFIYKNEELTKERKQLILKNTNLTTEREQLILKNTNLTNEKDQLILKNTNLINEREQLKRENNDLQRCLGKISKVGGWTYYQCSFYYMSSEAKSWTESKRYCTDRGADLIILNNRQEQEFVQSISGGNSVWIGLTDIDVEGRWKWVDGSTLTSGFWEFRQPNNYNGNEDCALSYASLWYAYSCNTVVKWICEI